MSTWFYHGINGIRENSYQAGFNDSQHYCCNNKQSNKSDSNLCIAMELLIKSYLPRYTFNNIAIFITTIWPLKWPFLALWIEQIFQQSDKIRSTMVLVNWRKINISGEFEADQRSQCACEEGTNPADNKYLPTHGEKQEQYLVTETQKYTDRRKDSYTVRCEFVFWELEPSQTGSYHSFRRLIVKYYTTSLINNCKPCIAMH